MAWRDGTLGTLTLHTPPAFGINFPGFHGRRKEWGRSVMPDPPANPHRRLLLTAALGCVLPGCRKEPDAPAPKPVPPASAGWLLTAGASPPDWSKLDPWQRAVTKDEFVRVLENVLTEPGAWISHIEVRDHAALIRMATPRKDGPRYVLEFAPPGSTPPPGPRYWRRLEELPALRDPARPLEGLHIALDPGHIGGSWAQMEERSNQTGDAPPVKEGDLTLRTARVLAPQLEALGAKVSYVRNRPEPVTAVRPGDLEDEARASLEKSGAETNSEAVTKETERLFYRAHEVRARGALVNEALRPDLVLCLHFNADVWGNAERTVFSSANHLHVLAHGYILSGEFSLDDQRFEGLMRLVQGVSDTEIPLCNAVAKRMAEATGLPPFNYRMRAALQYNARMVEGQPYVWMRNLIANRVYQCPVVFCEPYVQNNGEVVARFQAGDYEGTASVAGQERISIFREYASGVVAGLSDYFAARKRE